MVAALRDAVLHTVAFDAVSATVWIVAALTLALPLVVDHLISQQGFSAPSWCRSLVLFASLAII